MRKRLLAVLVAVLASLGFAAVVAGPAQATLNEEDYAVAKALSSESKHCVTSTYYQACVQPQGDYLWVRDKAKNGKPVHLFWGYEDEDPHVSTSA
jgi:hypothetical protein